MGDTLKSGAPRHKLTPEENKKKGRKEDYIRDIEEMGGR